MQTNMKYLLFLLFPGVQCASPIIRSASTKFGTTADGTLDAGVYAIGEGAMADMKTVEAATTDATTFTTVNGKTVHEGTLNLMKNIGKCQKTPFFARCDGNWELGTCATNAPTGSVNWQGEKLSISQAGQSHKVLVYHASGCRDLGHMGMAPETVGTCDPFGNPRDVDTVDSNDHNHLAIAQSYKIVACQKYSAKDHLQMRCESCMGVAPTVSGAAYIGFIGNGGCTHWQQLMRKNIEALIAKNVCADEAGCKADIDEFSDRFQGEWDDLLDAQWPASQSGGENTCSPCRGQVQGKCKLAQTAFARRQAEGLPDVAGLDDYWKGEAYDKNKLTSAKTVGPGDDNHCLFWCKKGNKPDHCAPDWASSCGACSFCAAR